MKMRSKHVGQRELDVKWINERWTPRIIVDPAGWRCAKIDLFADPLALFRKGPRKRRQKNMTWRRDNSRLT